MPVLLAAADFDGWLPGDAGPNILNPGPESPLREWIVSKRVNRTAADDDDPTLRDAVDEAA